MDHRLPIRRYVIAGAVAAAAVLLLAGVAFGFQASEKPGFCTSCHEMKPYHAAWETGPHARVSCVDCHVDPGLANHVSHKVVAAKELWDHLTGDPRFPRNDADVPDSRCLRCHSGIKRPVATGFSHAKHAKAGSCIACHKATGHRVSLEALSAEGVLRAGATEAVPPPAVASAPSTFSLTSTASPAPAWATSSGAAAATSTLHAATVCSGCHDLDKTACATCHDPKHVPDQQQAKSSQQCSTCHAPGTTWAFAHPAQASCTTCHAVPVKHRPGDCTSCHPQKGRSWAFSHPASNACTSCHKSKHRPYGAGCTQCHSPSRSFAQARVVHTARLACSGCHSAPRAHYGSRCVGCHRIGSTWKQARVVHTSGMRCSSCHSRGHRAYSSSCTSCHRSAGSSWRFTHPSSTRCTNCHRRPSNHYGSSCASCHRSRRSWAASFRHPSTGGEHTYRSFACVKCHPRGYGSASCTGCHGSGGGD